MDKIEILQQLRLLESALEKISKSESVMVSSFCLGEDWYFITHHYHLYANTGKIGDFQFLLEKQMPSGRFSEKGHITGHFEHDLRSVIDEKIITLRSVRTCERSRGLGSKLMVSFLKFAKHHLVDEIHASFYPADEWNAERRKHFYEKHGFIIHANGCIKYL